MSRSMGQYFLYANASVVPSTPQWKELFGPISAAMRAVAPRTTDTGQISPSVSGSSSGYEMFAFSDALQATKPIYIRIDYTSAAAPTFTLAVGTVKDGSGTLSGITYSPLSVMGNATTYTATSGQPRYCYTASGDGSYFTLLVGVQGSGVVTGADAFSAVVVERTRDADGTPNGNGYTVWRWNNAAEAGNPGTTNFVGVQSRIYDSSANVVQPSSTSFDINAVVPYQQFTTGLTSTTDTAQAYPVFGYASIMPQGASKAIAVAHAADVPRVGTTTLNQYGTPGTWLSMGTNTLQNIPYITNTLTGTTAVRTGIYGLSPVFRWE